MIDIILFLQKIFLVQNSFHFYSSLSTELKKGLNTRLMLTNKMISSYVLVETGNWNLVNGSQFSYSQ